MSTSPSQIIASLNSLHLGETDKIRVQLDAARDGCLALEQGELAQWLAEASAALYQADLRTYRRRVESVIARLGHLK